MHTTSAVDWSPRITDVQIRLRLNDQEAPVRLPLCDTEPEMVRRAHPWRTYRWLFGQKYYSGAYWSATTSRQVIYETRLQLRRLIIADYDPSVTHIVAQPFQLSALVDGSRRTYVPDYFMTTTSGPTVLDVAPHAKATTSQSVRSYAWIRQALATHDWKFELASEPSPLYFHNVHMLAANRRCPVTLQPALRHLRGLNLVGMTIGEAVGSAPTDLRHVRSALMHLLWTHHVTVDLHARIRNDTTLGTGTVSMTIDRAEQLSPDCQITITADLPGGCGHSTTHGPGSCAHGLDLWRSAGKSSLRSTTILPMAYLESADESD